MMELTTGVAFLMSSLYGSGQTAQVASIAATKANATTDTVTQSSITTNTIATQTTSSDTEAMKAYLRAEFGDDAILVDIARCESNYHQFDTTGNIIRGRVDRDDIGVMQINERYQGPTAKKLGFDIYTVEGNVAYAKHLYEEQGSKPWSSSEKCWGGGIAEK